MEWEQFIDKYGSDPDFLDIFGEDIDDLQRWGEEVTQLVDDLGFQAEQKIFTRKNFSQSGHQKRKHPQFDGKILNYY